MPHLTTEQQQALKVYKDTGNLDNLIILENLLLDHCLEWLTSSDHARDRFNSISGAVFPKNTNDFLRSNKEYQIIFIQTLLSRTLHGQAVIPFLNVSIDKPDFFCGDLRYYLLKYFTETCFDQGKGYQEAYQIINKMYLNSL